MKSLKSRCSSKSEAPDQRPTHVRPARPARPTPDPHWMHEISTISWDHAIFWFQNPFKWFRRISIDFEWIQVISNDLEWFRTYFYSNLMFVLMKFVFVFMISYNHDWNQWFSLKKNIRFHVISIEIFDVLLCRWKNIKTLHLKYKMKLDFNSV